MRALVLLACLATPAFADEDEVAIAKGRAACKGGDVEACFELADRLPWQDGGPSVEARDAADRAIRILARQCERKRVTSCSRLMSVDGWRDREFALRYSRRACVLGDGQGCANLADELDMIYANEPVAESLAMRRAACKGGHSWSCIKVAMNTKNRAAALRLYERACKLDVGSCLELADQLDESDPRRRALIDRAAAAGFRRGWVWWAHDTGGFIPE